MKNIIATLKRWLKNWPETHIGIAIALLIVPLVAWIVMMATGYRSEENFAWAIGLAQQVVFIEVALVCTTMFYLCTLREWPRSHDIDDSHPADHPTIYASKTALIVAVFALLLWFIHS